MLETDLLSLIGPQEEKAKEHFMSIPFFFYYKPKRKAQRRAEGLEACGRRRGTALFFIKVYKG
jgi:hypothetical protein